MAHRAAPISVSIALGHASANAVKATAGGWSTGSSTSLTFPLHSQMSSTRREGSEYHFKVFAMTRQGLEPTNYRLWGRRSTTGPSLRSVQSQDSNKYVENHTFHHKIPSYLENGITHAPHRHRLDHRIAMGEFEYIIEFCGQVVLQRNRLNTFWPLHVLRKSEKEKLNYYL